MEIRRLASIEELYAVADGDYLVRTDVAPDSDGASWLAGDGTFAFCGDLRDGRRGWLSVVGRPGATAEALVRRAVDELPALPWGLSVPRGTDLSWLDLDDRESWDYMVYDAAAAPAAPGRERVAVLPDTAESHAEIEETLKVANPTASTRPGSEHVRLWAGIRDPDGLLIAVGSYSVRDGGNGYLSSIGTRPEARGQGLGAALTAWLTSRSLEDGNPFCSLGHWHPNEPARRLYVRLGYRTTHAMSSGRFRWDEAAGPDDSAAAEVAGPCGGVGPEPAPESS